MPRPENKYYYPGFTLGGPVLLPCTKFNKKRDKLFFFTGYQYFYQVLDTGLLRATVPTAGDARRRLLAGRTRQARQHHRLRRPLPDRSTPRPWRCIPAASSRRTAIDPNMQALMKLYPLPNADPNANGGYNWVRRPALQPEQHAVDVARGLQHQRQHQAVRPLQPAARSAVVPDRPLVGATTQQLPYPTPIQGKNRSDSVTASLTHVFNSTHDE